MLGLCSAALSTIIIITPIIHTNGLKLLGSENKEGRVHLIVAV